MFSSYDLVFGQLSTACQTLLGVPSIWKCWSGGTDVELLAMLETSVDIFRCIQADSRRYEL